VRVFLYARPGHWRNCWELASLALDELKRKHGDDVHIVTAGSWARPEDLGSGIQHLGLLDYRETGDLYRTCDVGVALTVSAHPSYLPLELMACGVPVVAFDNPAGDWILHHEQNALRTPRTVDGLFDALDRMVTHRDLRSRLRDQGLADIAAGHSDWPLALRGIYDYLCDPEAGSAR
jgi:glycosyltransferase involved in cell wall biosynthesis